MVVLVIAGFAFITTTAEVKPFKGSKLLKVYILAGPSNMQGSAHKSTFAAMGDDPKTSPLLSEILDKNGEPLVCDNARITYKTQRSKVDTFLHRGYSR